MANPKQVIAKAKVRINGALQATGPGSTVLDPGGVTREPKDGDFETGGFSETAKGAKLTFKVLSDSRFNATLFGRYSDETVQVEFDNGQAWVIRHAFSEGTPSIGTDGYTECVLYGPTAELISA